MKNYFLLFTFILAFANVGVAQDPAIASPVLNPNPFEVASPATGQFTFNVGGGDIPAGSGLQVTISFLGATPTGPPSGTGAGLFDWVPLGNSYQGTQNQAFPVFTTGVILFNVNVNGALGTTGGFNVNLQGVPSVAEGNVEANDQASATAPIGVVSLPVELISFSGKVTNCDAINLTWKTGTEINNKGFEVERMDEGNRVFETLTFVEGLGTSVDGKVYELKLPFDSGFSGKPQFFRLKQIDFDGTFSYSEVIALGNHCFKDVELELFPNPAIDVVNVVLKAEGAGVQEVILINEFQQIERKININLNESNSIEIGDLAPGVYFLQVIYGNEFLVKRFVKVKN